MRGMSRTISSQRIGNRSQPFCVESSVMCPHETRCALPDVGIGGLKSGKEPICGSETTKGLTILNYWRWSGSDVLSNAPRGVFAEFLVGHALRAIDSPREAWASYDLKTREGIRVEVKSAAYVQSWYQNKLTEIRFEIGQKQNEDSTKRERPSDVYVFALLAEQDMKKINPLDIGQWEFYVVSTCELNRRYENQATLGINPLRRLARQVVPYAELEASVKSAAPRRVAFEG